MTVAVLREVRLYGPLRARFGRSHWLAVESPAEAVQALCMLFDGFRAALLGHKGPGYRVIVGEGAAADVRDEHSLLLAAGVSRAIRIAPVIHGNNKGAMMIVAGVALLVLAPYAAGAMFAAAETSLGVSAALAMASGGAMLGKALILGGVIQLLSPQPRKQGAQERQPGSDVLAGVGNMRAPGGPVPVIIGRVIVGSVEISAGLSTDDYTPPAVAPPAAPVLPPEQPLNPYLWGDERP